MQLKKSGRGKKPRWVGAFWMGSADDVRGRSIFLAPRPSVLGVGVGTQWDPRPRGVAQGWS
jgi:hypothetical protein